MMDSEYYADRIEIWDKFKQLEERIADLEKLVEEKSEQISNLSRRTSHLQVYGPGLIG